MQKILAANPVDYYLEGSRTNITTVLFFEPAMRSEFKMHMLSMVNDVPASNKKVTQSIRWLTLHKWPSTTHALAGLRQAGYRVAVADIDGELDVAELPLDQPISIWFGN